MYRWVSKVGCSRNQVCYYLMVCQHATNTSWGLASSSKLRQLAGLLKSSTFLQSSIWNNQRNYELPLEEHARVWRGRKGLSKLSKWQATSCDKFIDDQVNWCSNSGAINWVRSHWMSWICGSLSDDHIEWQRRWVANHKIKQMMITSSQPRCTSLVQYYQHGEWWVRCTNKVDNEHEEWEQAVR